MSIFQEIHAGLPREAPGSRKATEKAVELVGDLTNSPLVLDIGCGPGMQTMDLARCLSDAHIHAIDAHEPYVREVQRRAEINNVAARISAAVGDMKRISFPDGHFDLIWSEGAAYIMGVDNALRTWREKLKVGGCIAYTDLVWIDDDPPSEIMSFWQEGYPDMTTADIQQQRLVSFGFEHLGSFVLPPADWWTDYYTPLEAKIRELRTKYAGDTAAQVMLDQCQQEIDLYRDYEEYYSYLFVVGRRIS